LKLPAHFDFQLCENIEQNVRHLHQQQNRFKTLCEKIFGKKKRAAVEKSLHPSDSPDLSNTLMFFTCYISRCYCDRSF